MLFPSEDRRLVVSYIIIYLATQIYKLDAALHRVQHLVFTELVAGVAGDVGTTVVDAVFGKSFS